jgi:hypothetical protein
MEETKFTNTYTISELATVIGELWGNGLEGLVSIVGTPLRVDAQYFIRVPLAKVVIIPESQVVDLMGPDIKKRVAYCAAYIQHELTDTALTAIKDFPADPVLRDIFRAVQTVAASHGWFDPIS